MRKACFIIAVLCVLNIAACGFESEDIPTLPTLAVNEDVTKAPDGTMTPGLTAVPKVTSVVQTTIVPTVELKPTVSEKPASTPKPAVTEKPASTPKPTATPKPTSTPKPTATSKPTSTPKPTATSKPTSTPKPTATPRPVSSEIDRLLKLGKVYPNTIIRGDVCTGEAEANAFLREKSLTYSSFAMIVEKVEYLHSAKEYMAMYPEIEHMTIEKIDCYDNGFCAVFEDVDTVYDANLCYAIRTGNNKVLSGQEREIYVYLNDVLNETGAKQLAGVETVKVLHDYLVLELKYDENFREISHSPEGVIKNRTAVCDGYARTMRLLLLMSGIDCRIISGTAGNQPHAWNLVKLEDGWYHVDVTWDDPVPDVEGKVGYLYFLKNDADMAKTHVWESDITCSANNYQIYLYQDVLCESYEAMQAVYFEQIGEKEYLTFCYPKKGTLTQDLILEFIMNELQMGLTYYPEKELTDYMVLEIVNPLWDH